MNENQTSNVQKGLGKDALSVSDGTIGAATTSASADVKASNADQTQNQHLFHSYYQVNINCYTFQDPKFRLGQVWNSLFLFIFKNLKTFSASCPFLFRDPIYCVTVTFPFPGVVVTSA